MRLFHKRCMGALAPALLVAVCALCGAARAADSDDLAKLLEHADKVRTSDHAEFLKTLGDLAARRDALSAQQRAYLQYLDAYQNAYSGEYAAAIPSLRSIIEQSDDITLRFRAGVTLTNILALSAHYEEAYEELNRVVEMQPQIASKDERMLGYGIAALLYNQAGQYDLAMERAQKWLAEDSDDNGVCKATSLLVESLYRTGALAASSADIRTGVDACMRIRDPVYSNLIRTFSANLAIDQNRPTDAIRLLQGNYDEVQRTQYSRLTSEVDSILARAFLKAGDDAQAKHYAEIAVAKSVKDAFTKPLVDAYQVLYTIARQHGDFESALGYHEQYTAADKGYLSDTSSRALAYQMVSQQVLTKKRQVDVLHEKNQLLQLEQQVAAKSEETQRLSILLLLLVIAFITLWTFRIKRSQVRFRKLARRDGLTGIVNRQHFMDESKNVLVACAKSAREVCLILVDLDNFKTVNDTHGHIAGDGVLKQTVEMCQLHMRSADLFGRLGGEEFGVLLPNCPLETALQRAEELRRAIAAYAHAGVEVTVSASFGVASTRAAGYDLRQLLIHSDSALYRAKRGGRNRVEVFSSAAVADISRPLPLQV